MVREINGSDLALLYEARGSGFGRGGLVVDEYGVWPWFRRDYTVIRDAIELGIREAMESPSTYIQED